MIGNDIIDLSLAKTQSNWQRKGFLHKQFSSQEQALIYNSEHPFKSVWRLWSMKEAAYKAVVQQQNRRFFAPKKFDCTLNSATEGVVHFKGQAFTCTTTITRAYIYSSVGNTHAQWIVKKSEKEEFLKSITKHTDLPLRWLHIKKNAFGVPSLYCLDIRVSSSFSKTHHGNFEAYELVFLNLNDMNADGLTQDLTQ